MTDRFTTLPRELGLHILSFLSYDEIAKLRPVCRELNCMCMEQLNNGFNRAEAFHCRIQKEIRMKLPRRESERRGHEFSRHADILSAIETRMSLLQITYTKYMESGYCCFIPGKVLDELMSVLRYVRHAVSPPRSHEALMELRDISSMAMEHFEEKILPVLREQLAQDGVTVLPGGLTVGIQNGLSRDVPAGSKRRASGSPFTSPTSRKKLRLEVAEDFPSPSHQSPTQCSCSQLRKRLTVAEITINQQSKQLDELNRKMTDYNNRFNDLTDMLKLHFESSKEKTVIPDKLTRAFEKRTAHTESEPTTSASVITERLPVGVRVRKLKDRMDCFKDELNL